MTTPYHCKYCMCREPILTKYIRPGVLIYILTAYLSFTVLSAFGIEINTIYVQLLGQWGMLVMTAYFGGRTLEKIMLMKNKENNNDFERILFYCWSSFHSQVAIADPNIFQTTLSAVHKVHCMSGARLDLATHWATGSMAKKDLVITNV